MQRKALGRPEWSVCAGSFTLQVKERASWLFTIDRTGIASYDFNADHPKIAADDRLSNLDHREDKVDRGEGRFERSTAKRAELALGLRQRSARRHAAVRKQKGAAPMLKEQARLEVGLKVQLAHRWLFACKLICSSQAEI